MHVYICVCINLNITALSGPVMSYALCRHNWSPLGGINDCFAITKTLKQTRQTRYASTTARARTCVCLSLHVTAVVVFTKASASGGDDDYLTINRQQFCSQRRARHYLTVTFPSFTSFAFGFGSSLHADSSYSSGRGGYSNSGDRESFK